MRRLLTLCAAAIGLALATTPARALEVQTCKISVIEAEVGLAEDMSAIKRLQRAYGYYLDKGLWADLIELFADDASANYPAGVFVGKASIRAHLFENFGTDGKVGLGDGRIYNHMILQPVVHIDPGGQTAHGRWRAFAQIGRLGGGASWAEGVYEIAYVKAGGVWKIKTLDYHSGFGANYEGGWGAVQPVSATAGPRRQRPTPPHPPDRPRDEPCGGYPAACVAPFHYKDLGTAAGGAAWPATPTADSGDCPTDHARVGALVERARRLDDEQVIENLIGAWGYYIDRAMWDDAADLFAAKGTLELGQRGVYQGKAHIRKFLAREGPLTDGWLNDHIQLQPVVTVFADGTAARARSRELDMMGRVGDTGRLGEGVYENAFVREGGVWKIRALHFYPTFLTDYSKGWGKDAQAMPGPLADPKPDRPPSERYEIYPKAHIPPFHFTNPVTGKAPTYPGKAEPEQFVGVTPAPRTPPKGTDQTLLAEAAATVARVKDHHEIENLENAYGYYLDKNLWDEIADLMSTDGSMELAQRGVYRGRERVRGFLKAVFGAPGPKENRLGNHMQLQPVIHVGPDGKTAKIRIRMLQQLAQAGGRGNWGGAIYENEAVKEDGAWRLKSVHPFNTFGADYVGGWTVARASRVPGPSQSFPPDGPPTVVFEMFPSVYPIPVHYPNPVTGKPARPEAAIAHKGVKTP